MRSVLILHRRALSSEATIESRLVQRCGRPSRASSVAFLLSIRDASAPL